MDKSKLIICPNNIKLDLLRKNKSLENIKYMTKSEYLSKYYFSYDEKSIYYLMDKYNLDIDVCKVYLESLYIIEDKDYENDKLKFLKDIKKELIDNNLLYFSNYNFKNKNIEVVGYYDLDLFEEEALNYKFEIPEVKLTNKVYELESIEDEINFVCIKIIELINSGIDINKIYLTNVTDEYLYPLKKIFSYYKIPIELDFKNSIYSSLTVKKYLEDKDINLSDTSITNKKLVNVLNSLSDLDKDSSIYKSILIDKLKNTYISNPKYNNSIKVKSLNSNFTKDEYVFLLGFNQDILPKVYKDIEYITDSIKDEVKMYKTTYLNKKEKVLTKYLINRIDNLTISYKLQTPFDKYYPSSIINEDNLEVIRDFTDNYNYSNFYNEIRLGQMLDDYSLYNKKDNILEVLNSNYNTTYNTYSNKYTGIDNDLYKRSINNPLRLSYTSLNTYNECSFKYYLKYVLKLDIYEDRFESFIGSLYHHILSLYKNNNFDLDKEFNNYLEKRDLSLKEVLLLKKIKDELKEFINVLNIQNTYTLFRDELYEQEAKVILDKDISVEFIGYIDKIMYHKNIEDTYFSIIDYKTGNIDTNILPMKYGLHMQLPVYLYLIHYSKVFTNPIFTGIYYQNILFNYPKWDKDIEKINKTKYYLNGYSTDNLEVLEKFDNTYFDSLFIKSLKYTDKFDRYSKILDDDTMFKLIKYTKDHISSRVDNILDSKFDINPVHYNKKDVSCEYCKFKDICFKTDKDMKYLPKVEDLSFLGGEV